MGGIGNRLERLERAASEHFTTVACPECGERFWGAGDVALGLVVADWQEQTGQAREPDPTVDAIRTHPHEALRREVLQDIPAFRRA